MKFGKLIRNEALNNSKIVLINYKLLKTHLKRWAKAFANPDKEIVANLDRQFYDALCSEVAAVGINFWNELNLVSKQCEAFAQDFEQFKSILQIYTPLEVSNRCDHQRNTNSFNESSPLYRQCCELNKISVSSKDLRCMVLWNSVAIIKILKKRTKYYRDHEHLKCLDIAAAKFLSSQDWYQSRQLSHVISYVETAMEAIMQYVTQEPINSERYHCPICLDIILDPVCLRVCGHRFCWSCLCMAYCEKSEGVLERCPYCRTIFHLDPEAFRVDSILSQFIRTIFPCVQPQRKREQQERIRERLQALSPGNKTFLASFLQQDQTEQSHEQQSCDPFGLFSQDDAGHHSPTSFEFSRPNTLFSTQSMLEDLDYSSQSQCPKTSPPNVPDTLPHKSCKESQNSVTSSPPSQSCDLFIVDQMLEWLLIDNQKSQSKDNVLSHLETDMGQPQMRSVDPPKPDMSICWRKTIQNQTKQLYYEAIDDDDDDFENFIE